MHTSVPKPRAINTATTSNIYLLPPFFSAEWVMGWLSKLRLRRRKNKTPKNNSAKTNSPRSASSSVRKNNRVKVDVNATTKRLRKFMGDQIVALERLEAQEQRLSKMKPGRHTLKEIIDARKEAFKNWHRVNNMLAATERQLQLIKGNGTWHDAPLTRTANGRIWWNADHQRLRQNVTNRFARRNMLLGSETIPRPNLDSAKRLRNYVAKYKNLNYHEPTPNIHDMWHQIRKERKHDRHYLFDYERDLLNTYKTKRQRNSPEFLRQLNAAFTVPNEPRPRRRGPRTIGELGNLLGRA